jgi:DMSO/TMAO reductase YedYZ molybdopterin-dependent catalytic subunit
LDDQIDAHNAAVLSRSGNSGSKGTTTMEETPISRGFRSRRQEQTSKSRLPPGQYVTTDFPVLSAGPTSQIKLEDWTLALQLGGSLLGTWNWAEFEALPQTTIKTDMHANLCGARGIR